MTSSDPSNPLSKVLVVDDDPNVLSAVRRIPVPADFTWFTAASSAESLELLDQHTFDVALVDHHLGPGGLTGLDFLARLHGHDPDCFRIIFTGVADLAFSITAINRGHIDAFLLKPWSDEQIIALLRQGRETARLRRSNRELVFELSEQNRELERFNFELERAVQERTKHLQLAHARLQEKQQELIRVETQGAVAQLARGLAHELNNPLAAILGYSQRMQRKLSADEDTVRRLDVIVSEVARCRALVDQLRNLAAPLDEEVVVCDPEIALNTAIVRLRESGREPPALESVGTIPMVMAGRQSLSRVFEQILDNATLAGAKRCWFKGEAQSDRVQLTLENDGETPSEEAVLSAIKPFFTTMAQQGRRGLGLAISAALLREQGGTIALSKRASERGACCSIWLPQPPDYVDVSCDLTAQKDSDAMVLIVDDEPLIAELLNDCLAETGCRAVEVASVGEALDLIGSKRIRAVLADMHLPDGNGVDLLDRAIALYPALKGHVALVTGDGQADTKELISASGYPILAKPFRLEQVSGILRKIL
jgi:response regulator RpfG family c-di-GMP phosphodiesterase